MSKERQSAKEKRASNYLALNNYAVFLMQSIGEAKVINHTSLLIQKVNQPLADMFVNNKHYWKYRMFALCRTQQGEQYIVISDQPIFTINGKKNLPFKQLDVAAALDEAHRKFLTTVNTYQLLNTGWLAFPYHHEFTEDELIQKIDKICDIYDCWNYQTKYEHEKAKNS